MNKVNDVNESVNKVNDFETSKTNSFKVNKTNNFETSKTNNSETIESNLFSITAHQFLLTNPNVYLTDMRRISLIDSHGRFLTINKRREIWERESSMFCKNNNFNYWIIVLADNWKDKKKDESDINSINLKKMNVQPFIHCLGFIDVDMIAKNIRNYVNEINRENGEKFLKITCFDDFRVVNDRVLDEKRMALMGNGKDKGNGEDNYHNSGMDNRYGDSGNNCYGNNTDNYRLTRVIVFKKKWSEIE